MILPPPRPGNAPLRVLAETGRLPDHQYMDRTTLAWIAGNRPTGVGVRATIPHRPLLLVPEGSWFARRETADSVHGIRHGARVAILVQLLAHIHGIDPDRRPSPLRRPATTAGATTTAMTRATDSAPSSALPPCPRRSRSSPSTTSPTTPSRTAGASAYRRHQDAADLLKAADALDRYRLPLTRWWPDPSRVRLSVPAWLHPLAHDLVVHSEQARLHGAPDTQALKHALRATLPE
ncbi:hypothetical protein ACIRRH_02965 [Kitasatospora sp. NPDC101235]|uniref:hypothetical protein n=1 Tax=Kitasatospora sp. NPDC101235 TaxID=3364101 RepID=UPI003809C210